MGFKNNAYATVWGVEDKGKFATVRLSTSRRNAETKEYETDFSGYCMFVGEKAHNFALSLREKDRIRLISCDVTSTFSKESNKSFINYKVFEAELADPAPTNKKKYDDPEVEAAADADEVPF